MATLIPAIGGCVSRMTSGEKRFAYRLEAKLEADYLCWYDVAIGEPRSILISSCFIHIVACWCWR